MPDLRDLYQQLIIDHNQHPQNFGTLDGIDPAEGHNPLCGDRLELYLDLTGGHIHDIRFEGSGCAIFKASTSIMTTMVKGLSREEALALFERFHRLATTGERNGGEMGKLEALADVHKYPARVKCALLAWRTLQAGLQDRAETITTE